MSSTLDAAYNLVADYEGGAASLGPRIGKNGTTLSHELNRTGSAKLGLLDAVKMSVLSGDLRILHAYATECGQMCVPLPEALDVSCDDTMRRLAATALEFSDLVQAVSLALADGRVTDNELSLVDRKGGELINAWSALRASLASRNRSLRA